MIVAWYFDVISPFAYLALLEVESLRDTVVYRPILLAGVLQHWGQLGPAEIPPKRLHTYRLCVFEAARRRLPFRMPPVHPFNPLGPLRLLTALGAAPWAVRTTMDLIWSNGVDPSTPEGWVRLHQALDVPDPDALIERTGAKAALRTATEAAVACGVFGVPTLEAAGALFWGLDAMPLARATMADPALLSTGEMGRLASLGSVSRPR